MRSFLTFLLISISIFSFKLSECFSSSNITDSFSAYPVARGVSVGIRSRGVLGTDKYLVSIHKAALGKEFILKSNVIFLDVVQNFSSLKTRIVSFRQTPDRLFMTDVTGHNSFSKDLPQNIILTSFKIVQETSDEIFFDFNQGMSQLFIASEWKASDFEGDTYSPDYQSVDVSQSYLEDIQVNSEKNRLYIRQIAQLPL
ncbi:MAG: hypothetical protein HYS98_06460, partial [Deltaproteobacteria bacterium]|nr:hypothetical protein [Deltaproteobacteria bacterium]